MFPRLEIAPRAGVPTDFSFVNLIEHKAEEITRFYGSREHKFKCPALPGRRLNRAFEAMRPDYAERTNPSANQAGNNAAVHGRGQEARGRRGRTRKMTARRMANMHHRCAAVPDTDAPRHRICRESGMSIHALATDHALEPCQADTPVPSRDDQPRSRHLSVTIH